MKVQFMIDKKQDGERKKGKVVNKGSDSESSSDLEEDSSEESKSSVEESKQSMKEKQKKRRASFFSKISNPLAGEEDKIYEVSDDESSSEEGQSLASRSVKSSRKNK